MMELRFSKRVLPFLVVLFLGFSVQAETRQEGEWFIHDVRAVQQEGLQHHVCSLRTEEVILCFEFLWAKGRLTLWVQVSLPEESAMRFEDGYASDLWIDGKVLGSMYRGELTGSTNSMLDIDRFLGADRSQYYYYGGDWLFSREVTAPPAHYLSNHHTFYQKIIHAKQLRLVHHLEGGETFATEYDLDGLTPLLTAAFEEAAAMEHKYGKTPAAE